MDSVISNILLMGACVLVSNVLNYYLPTKERYIYILVLCAVLSVIWFFLSRTLIILLTNNAADYEHFFSQSVPVRFSIGFLIIGCMALVSVLWYTLQDQQQNEKRRSDAERLAKEAELYKLRQQLQPHFAKQQV